MSRKTLKAVRNGWITDQHGSWAMGFVPLIYGLGLAWPLSVAHLVMVAAWTCGFFFFAVADKWLKFRFNARYQPALITYGGLSGIFCLTLVLLAPHLLWWLLLYVPLIAISFHRSWRRKERELSARLVTISAATLVLAVVVNIAIARPWYDGGVTTKAWLFTGLFATYFASTVPYVKTLIRKRGSTPWFIGSVFTHIAIVVVMIVLALWHWVPWWHVGIWFILLSRAVIMPVLAQQRAKPWQPRQVGLSEMVLSVLVFFSMPFQF